MVCLWFVYGWFILPKIHPTFHWENLERPAVGKGGPHGSDRSGSATFLPYVCLCVGGLGGPGPGQTPLEPGVGSRISWVKQRRTTGETGETGELFSIVFLIHLDSS